jgi:hypothetical protein
MKPRDDLKMYTLRHFLFYMGVTCVVGTVLSIASRVMGWSNGLTFVLVLVTGLTISAIAMREGLFGPSQSSDARHQHSRHA